MIKEIKNHSTTIQIHERLDKGYFLVNCLSNYFENEKYSARIKTKELPFLINQLNTKRKLRRDELGKCCFYFYNDFDCMIIRFETPNKSFDFSIEKETLLFLEKEYKRYEQTNNEQ